MDFTQMPVSQGYKYLLVMIDTFTGWIEGFSTQMEKEGGGKINCSMKSFWDLVCPSHYKVTMGHHLLLRSPKGSLKHWHYLYSLCLEASVFRKSKKSQPVLKISNRKDNPDLPGVEGGFTKALLCTYIVPKEQVGLSPYEMLYGRPFFMSMTSS